MANKRDFKKYVECLGATVCENMMTSYYNVEGIDHEAVEQAIGKVLGASGAAKSHANIFFDKGEKAFADKKEYLTEKKRFFKALFQKIASDFEAEMGAALKQYNAAIPESVRKQQKEAVAG